MYYGIKQDMGEFLVVSSKLFPENEQSYQTFKLPEPPGSANVH